MRGKKQEIHHTVIETPHGRIIIFAPFQGTTEKTWNLIGNSLDIVHQELIGSQPISNLTPLSDDFQVKAPTIYAGMKDSLANLK